MFTAILWIVGLFVGWCLLSLAYNLALDLLMLMMKAVFWVFRIKVKD